MKIDLQARGYRPSDKFRDMLQKKVDRLDKFLEEDTIVKVVLKQSKEMYILELTIFLDSVVLRTEVLSGNMFDNIDTAVSKLEKQIVRHHGKISKKSKARIKLIDIPVIDEVQASVVRKKFVKLASMSIDDAISELELVGHSFYLFVNSDNGKTTALYTRHTGDYGIIELSDGLA